ncbi:MAG: DUF1015 domain-containing protein [Clostridiaceae bacterium]|nr:DUF1015 domain-containing protein [Clostridiaceae bacterium]
MTTESLNSLGSHETIFNKTGVSLPEVLLPAEGTDMQKWAVVACDQYTSQPGYWEEVERIVGNSPSALRLILPEVYLENSNVDDMISNINITMKKYLDDGLLVPHNPCFIYLDRETPRVKSRKGLILAVDLEKYDYTQGSRALIRSTEKTVPERLPPRIKIRRNAPIEVPHVQLLVDDPEMAIFGHLENAVQQMDKIYDFDLMMNGGHIKGYKIERPSIIRQIAEVLEKLTDPELFADKYDVDPEDTGILLFAVGDGNHSLASAKAHWENKKTQIPKEMQAHHPARYAMAEVVNVHDEGLIFEPIHRVLFNANPETLIKEMDKHFSTVSPFHVKSFPSKELMEQEKHELAAKFQGSHIFPFVTNHGYGIIIIEKPRYNLDVATLQDFLDSFLKSNPSAKIDYIHGENAVTSIGEEPGNLGFYLNPIDKHGLFKTVLKDGVLPRKTFSMGEAEEKRYYLECKII